MSDWKACSWGKYAPMKAIIGNRTLPYKRENPVKSCYVKELLSIIEEQEA
jgi:hypothetical protein